MTSTTEVFTNDAAREVVREKLTEMRISGAESATDSELVSAAEAHYYGGLDKLLADKAGEIERMSIYAVRMLHMRGPDMGKSFTFQTSASTTKGARSKARSAHPTATPTSTRRIVNATSEKDQS